MSVLPKPESLNDHPFAPAYVGVGVAVSVLFTLLGCVVFQFCKNKLWKNDNSRESSSQDGEGKEAESEKLGSDIVDQETSRDLNETVASVTSSEGGERTHLTSSIGTGLPVRYCSIPDITLDTNHVLQPTTSQGPDRQSGETNTSKRKDRKTVDINTTNDSTVGLNCSQPGISESFTSYGREKRSLGDEHTGHSGHVGDDFPLVSVHAGEGELRGDVIKDGVNNSGHGGYFTHSVLSFSGDGDGRYVDTYGDVIKDGVNNSGHGGSFTHSVHMFSGDGDGRYVDTYGGFIKDGVNNSGHEGSFTHSEHIFSGDDSPPGASDAGQVWKEGEDSDVSDYLATLTLDLSTDHSVMPDDRRENESHATDDASHITDDVSHTLDDVSHITDDVSHLTDDNLSRTTDDSLHSIESFSRLQDVKAQAEFSPYHIAWSTPLFPQQHPSCQPRPSHKARAAKKLNLDPAGVGQGCECIPETQHEIMSPQDKKVKEHCDIDHIPGRPFVTSQSPEIDGYLSVTLELSGFGNERLPWTSELPGFGDERLPGISELPGFGNERLPGTSRLSESSRQREETSDLSGLNGEQSMTSKSPEFNGHVSMTSQTSEFIEQMSMTSQSPGFNQLSLSTTSQSPVVNGQLLMPSKSPGFHEQQSMTLQSPVSDPQTENPDSSCSWGLLKTEVFWGRPASMEYPSLQPTSAKHRRRSFGSALQKNNQSSDQDQQPLLAYTVAEYRRSLKNIAHLDSTVDVKDETCLNAVNGDRDSESQSQSENCPATRDNSELSCRVSLPASSESSANSGHTSDTTLQNCKTSDSQVSLDNTLAGFAELTHSSVGDWNASVSSVSRSYRAYLTTSPRNTKGDSLNNNGWDETLCSSDMLHSRTEHLVPAPLPSTVPSPVQHSSDTSPDTPSSTERMSYSSADASPELLCLLHTTENINNNRVLGLSPVDQKSSESRRQTCGSFKVPFPISVADAKCSGTSRGHVTGLPRSKSSTHKPLSQGLLEPGDQHMRRSRTSESIRSSAASLPLDRSASDLSLAVSSASRASLQDPSLTWDHEFPAPARCHDDSLTWEEDPYLT